MKSAWLKALAAGWILTWAVAMAGEAMPAQQQNALVQKYCAVCHTDAARNGGLSLQHFDAARPDPGVAAMMLGKLKTGAIGASGVKRPDDATIQAWISATSAEAAGANRWRFERAEATKLPIVSASIVEQVPSARGADVPSSYRLTATCNPDTHEAGMELAWSPVAPRTGQVFSALVDGKALSTYTVEGVEEMGNGSGVSGAASIALYAAAKTAGLARLPIPLPRQTLTIRDVFAGETVVFPFHELSQAERQALSSCFTDPAAK